MRTASAGSAAFRRVGLLFSACALAAAAPPAFTADREPEPVVSVRGGDHGETGSIHGQVDINAPRATVWRLMVDCEKEIHMTVDAKSCKMLQRDPAGHWDVREQISKGGGFMPSVRIVLRSEYDAPHTVRFHRVEGTIKALDGTWRLEPLDGGRTRAFYDCTVSVPGAPGPIARMVLRHDIPRMLVNLRDASEADAGRP